MLCWSKSVATRRSSTIAGHSRTSVLSSMKSLQTDSIVYHWSASPPLIFRPRGVDIVQANPTNRYEHDRVFVLYRKGWKRVAMVISHVMCVLHYKQPYVLPTYILFNQGRREEKSRGSAEYSRLNWGAFSFSISPFGPQTEIMDESEPLLLFFPPIDLLIPSLLIGPACWCCHCVGFAFNILHVCTVHI